jgi:hypothetical protein
MWELLLLTLSRYFTAQNKSVSNELETKELSILASLKLKLEMEKLVA